LLGYTLPTISGLTLPIAFLMGGTLTFQRLSMDSEYVVMQAAGISLYRLLVPLLLVASVVYGLSSFLLMYVSPWGFQGLQQLFFEIAYNRAYYQLQAGEFNQGFKDLVLYVEHTHPESQSLEGIFIADGRAEVSQVITARQGSLSVDPQALRVVLRLTEGMIHRYAPSDKRYHLMHFGAYDITLDLDTRLARQAGAVRQPRALFPFELLQEIARRQALGKEARSLQLFWHKLFALPFACFLFAALGPVLGVVHTRSGRSGGYVLGLGGIFAYYILLAASDALGQETPFPPLLAAWLPNICMAVVTLVCLSRTARGHMRLDFSGLLARLRRRGHRAQPA
jgi:lipopolysaccharide export system permease protein